MATILHKKDNTTTVITTVKALAKRENIEICEVCGGLIAGPDIDIVPVDQLCLGCDDLS